MNQQITDTLLMIRPVAFHKNEETAVNNYFQADIVGSQPTDIQRNAQREFDAFVEKLRAVGVTVHVLEDIASAGTPDSIFPNNWISFHEEGIIRLYPMFAENRRKERREDIVDFFKKEYAVNEVLSLTDFEANGQYLEGTGSLILDRKNKIAYACISQRTNREVLTHFSNTSGFKVVHFTANQTVDDQRLPIYHTNVMMALGENFALICLDTIDQKEEREKVVKQIIATNKEIIEITEEQMHHFAGNLLQVKGSQGRKYVVMSQDASDNLTSPQKEKLSRHGQLLVSAIPTIETLGGGSVRCMMAEVFLPKK